jgi:hypothetical protein
MTAEEEKGKYGDSGFARMTAQEGWSFASRGIV